MSEAERRDEAGEEEAGPEVAPTPFDGPYFLPVVLTGLALWFGYDGWLNDDPSMQEWWWFNQGGAVIFALGAAWFGYKAWRESAEG